MEDKTFVRFVVRQAATFMSPPDDWFFTEVSAANAARRLAEKGRQARIYGVTRGGEYHPIGYYLPEDGNVWWIPYQPVGDTKPCQSAPSLPIARPSWGYSDEEVREAA